MAYALKWDEVGKRFYETGVQNVTLFTMNNEGKYNPGVAWNGVTEITKSPSGAEETALYADNMKYLSLRSVEELGGSITAYDSPDEFDACDGSATLAPGVTIRQQARINFAVAYINNIGNDTEGDSYGERLNIIYNMSAAPSERTNTTINDSPEAGELSWEYSTTGINVTIPGMKLKATSLLEVESLTADPEAYQLLKDTLFGIEAADWSNATDYKKGDYVKQSEKTYRCKTPVMSGSEWLEDNWEEVKNPGSHLPSIEEIYEMFNTAAQG